jgi:hypothetical protein
MGTIDTSAPTALLTRPSPADSSGASSPSGARGVAAAANTGLRFLVELAAYASFGYWGAAIDGPMAVRASMAIVAPLIAIVVWSQFLAPKARRPLRDPAALLVELLIFATAAIALARSGLEVPASVFGVVAMGNTLLIRFFRARASDDVRGEQTP